MGLLLQVSSLRLYFFLMVHTQSVKMTHIGMCYHFSQPKANSTLTQYPQTPDTQVRGLICGSQITTCSSANNTVPLNAYAHWTTVMSPCCDRIVNFLIFQWTSIRWCLFFFSLPLTLLFFWLSNQIQTKFIRLFRGSEGKWWKSYLTFSRLRSMENTDSADVWWMPEVSRQQNKPAN